MEKRLSGLEGLPASVITPKYDRSKLKVGILHFGPGMFHRAHQAQYTDAILAAGASDWAIEGVELRDTDVDARLNPQHGLYTLLVCDAENPTAQVVGSLLKVIVAPRDPQAVLSRIADPSIRIISITVTEKAYGLDLKTGGLDENHPDIAADLANPGKPRSLVGYLVEGLARRRAEGGAPVTVLSCDNLADNGKKLKRLVLEFAGKRDAALRQWIDTEVPFPCTMVDRITPAASDKTLADAKAAIGRDDLAAVETEPFKQWVIEDHFAAGRPDWDKAGAIFTRDVAPFEYMKLRMLNGSHSLLAYLGFLNGLEFVRDTMADPALAKLIRAHMSATAKTLKPVAGIDYEAYADALCARFANKAIAHATYQIAMDGTQKLPQRLLEPVEQALKAGLNVETFAITVAAWMVYTLGRTAKGEAYDIRDPRGDEITALLKGVEMTGAAICDRLFKLPGLFSPYLQQHEGWRSSIISAIDLMIQKGPHASIDAFAAKH